MNMSEQAHWDGKQTARQPGQANLFDYADRQEGDFHIGLFEQSLGVAQLVAAYRGSHSSHDQHWQEDVHYRLRRQASWLNKTIGESIFQLDLYDSCASSLALNQQDKGHLISRLYTSGDRALFGRTTKEIARDLGEDSAADEAESPAQPAALDDLLDNQQLIMRNWARRALVNHLVTERARGRQVEARSLLGFYVNRNLRTKDELAELDSGRLSQPAGRIDQFALPASHRKLSLKDWHDYYEEILSSDYGYRIEPNLREQLKQQLLAHLGQLNTQTELKINQLNYPPWHDAAVMSRIDTDKLNYVRLIGDCLLLGRSLVGADGQTLARLNQERHQSIDTCLEPAILLARIKVQQRFNHPSRKLNNLMNARDTYKQLNLEVAAELKQELPNQYKQLANLNVYVSQMVDGPDELPDNYNESQGSLTDQLDFGVGF